MRRYLLPFILAFYVTATYSQAAVEWDYFMASRFRNHDKEDCGKGDLQRVRARVSVPLSSAMDDKGQPRVWTLTLSASHGWLENEGLARELNPARILNANLSVSHMRSIGEKWTLIASLGAGIYAPTDYVTFKSVLANGGAIFAYRLADNLSIGLGAGLTNAYGAPMIVPMGYLDWRLKGRVEVMLNISNGIKTRIGVRATDRLSVNLVPVEFDGMSAVIKRDGKDRLYSMFMIRSNLSLDVDAGKGIHLYGGIGEVLLRNTTIKERRIGSLFSGSDRDRYRFSPTPQFLAGIRCIF